MKLVLALAVVSLLTGSTASAQNWVSPESGTGAIRGRVMAADGAGPLSRAEVRLSGRTVTRVLLADEQGRYGFKDLPAGRYKLSAGRSGYLTLNYGQQRSTDRAAQIELAAGQSREDVDFVLPKAGVIDVTVVDESGEPQEGATVKAQQLHFSNGRPEFVFLEAAGLTQRNFATDDRGRLRLYDLPPGDYYVMATLTRLGSAPIEVRDGINKKKLSYRPTFYPGTLSVNDAQPVALALGQEVRVRIPIVAAPVARISGRVLHADGSLLTTGMIRLAPVSGNRTALTSPAASAVLSPKGFEFLNVPPGNYVIERNPIHDQPPSDEYGELSVTVSGTDISDLVITTGKAATLRGKLVLDAGPPPRDWKAQDFSLRLTLSNGYAEVGLEDDGTFTRLGLTGTALGWTSAGRGWFLKAVMLSGQDITDAPMVFSSGLEIDDLRVLISRKTTAVSGGARDDQDQPVSDYTAVIFAEDPRLWTPSSRFFGRAYPDDDGRFNIVGLPPGRYVAAAVDNLERGWEQDPAFLGRLKQRAAPFTLGENESKILDLRLVVF